MPVKVEINFTEPELVRINPQPGDVLLFKFKGDQFMEEDVNEMGKQIRPFFPNNKVIVMALPDGHDVELTAVANQDKVESTKKDCSSPTEYCDDCTCGKKEQLEGG